MNKRPPLPGNGRGKVLPPRSRTILGTRAPRTGLAVKTPAPKPVSPPPQQKVSRLPLFAFAAIALVGLGISAAALMIHVLTGGRQTEFSEEILNQELVPVEIATDESAGGGTDSADEGDAAVPDISRPAIMDLAGNPILVRRQQNVPRQVLKIEGEAAKAAAALKLPGEVFRLTDSLGAPDGGLAAGVPGSQLGFAFTQTEGEDEDSSEGVTPVDLQAQDATVVTVGGDEDPANGANRTIFIKAVEADTTLSALLGEAGFDAEKSKDVEAAAKRRLGIEI